MQMAHKQNTQSCSCCVRHWQNRGKNQIDLMSSTFLPRIWISVTNIFTNEIGKNGEKNLLTEVNGWATLAVFTQEILYITWCASLIQPTKVLGKVLKVHHFSLSLRYFWTAKTESISPLIFRIVFHIRISSDSVNFDGGRK